MFGLDLQPKPGEPMYPSDNVPSDDGDFFYPLAVAACVALLVSLPSYLIYLLVQAF